MRLYSRDGATAVDDGGKHYVPGDDGGFDFPEDLGQRQHAFHVAGRPLWETSIERQRRLMAEELERRKDPATLLAAVETLVAAASAATPEPAVKAAGTAKPAAKTPTPAAK